MNGLRVWAEVDLDALGHNLSTIRKQAGDGVRLMLVVKADAYGHGAVAVAHHAVRFGIGALGVGNSEEALELRQAGIRIPILVLGTVIDEELQACLSHDIHIGIHTSGRAERLEGLASALGCQAKVHLNVDTGMGRLGVPPARALPLLRRLTTSPHIELAGVMSHLAGTLGGLEPEARQQARTFEGFLARAREISEDLGWIHLANSAGIFSGLGRGYDTVRPGLAAYGSIPPELPGSDELQPVMSLRSQVVFIRDIPQGTPVGYGSTWRAGRATRIATLPIGYADGLPWRTGSKAEVLLRGQRAPVIGRISMDYITVDVGHIRDVVVGDTATLVGTDGDQAVTLEQMADHAGTIPYEISCGMGRRVRRLYLGGEQVAVPAQKARGRGGVQNPDSAPAPFNPSQQGALAPKTERSEKSAGPAPSVPGTSPTQVTYTDF